VAIVVVVVGGGSDNNNDNNDNAILDNNVDPTNVNCTELVLAQPTVVFVNCLAVNSTECQQDETCQASELHIYRPIHGTAACEADEQCRETNKHQKLWPTSEENPNVFDPDTEDSGNGS